MNTFGSISMYVVSDSVSSTGPSPEVSWPAWTVHQKVRIIMGMQ